MVHNQLSNNITYTSDKCKAQCNKIMRKTQLHPSLRHMLQIKFQAADIIIVLVIHHQVVIPAVQQTAYCKKVIFSTCDLD